MITREKLKRAIQEHQIIIDRLQKVIDSDTAAVAAGVSIYTDRVELRDRYIQKINEFKTMLESTQ